MKQIIFFLLLFTFLPVNVNALQDNDVIKKAALNGDLYAQKYMARVLLLGKDGYSINREEGKKWLLAAANQGDAESIFQYGMFTYIYVNGNQWTNLQEIKDALPWMEKAAQLEYAPAQVALGISLSLMEEYSDAFKWLKKAADASFVPAYYSLGNLYRKGLGTERNIQAAITYYQKAIDSGIFSALTPLGECYYSGIEIKPDYTKAKNLFQKSIEKGQDVEAFVCMSHYYYDGKAEPPNYKEAHKYIRKAISAEPNNPKYYDFEGEIFLQENDTKSALDIWDILQRIDPNYGSLSSSNFCMSMRSSFDQNVDWEIYENGKRNNNNTFVVIISNENYKRVEPVPFANNDGKIFKEYCIKTLCIPESNIQFVEDATYNDIKYTVNWLSNIIEAYSGKAKIIFYYAGHGIPDEKQSTAYLLPIDGYSNDVTTGYKMDDLYTSLGAMLSESVMVFLDACFSGTKREGDMMASARGVAIKVKKATPSGNMVVLSAAQGDETAYPYSEQKHGMFTYYLLRKLQETKGEASLGEISDYVISEVKKNSIVKNGKMQTPTVVVSGQIGENWKNWTLK